MKAVLFIALMAVLGSAVYMGYTEGRPYVLAVVSSKYTGSDDTAAFQEFTNQQRCLYALGFVKGAASSVVAECIPK